MKYIVLFIKKTLRFVLKPLSFVPAMLVMYMIFSLSAQTGTASSELSLKVTKKLADLAALLFHLDLEPSAIHFYIRKLGHISEYFLLAFTVALPLYVYRVRGIRLMLFAGAFCVGFAALDEYHQSFVAGRGPSSQDVFIDSIGIFIGIIFVRIIGFIGRKTIFNPLSSKK